MIRCQDAWFLYDFKVDFPLLHLFTFFYGFPLHNSAIFITKSFDKNYDKI